MMKFLTTALGGLTVATVTGLALLPGHAMLGGQQPQAQAPVSVITDPGPEAAVPAPVVPPAAPAVAPAARPAATQPAVTQPAPAVSRPVAQPVARPVPRPAAPAPAAGPAPAASPMGGLNGAGAITQLLLNMPQVLQGGQDGPQGGPGWVPPGQHGRAYRKHHDGGGDNNAGDYER